METFPSEQLPDEAVTISREIEPTVEAQKVMEEAQAKRATLLERVINRKNMEMTATIMPGIDIGTFAAFAARGKTFTGMELNGKERVNYAAMAGLLALSYSLLAAGMDKEALEAKGAAWTFAGKQFIDSGLLQKTIDAAKEKMPSMIPFIERTGEFIGGDSEVITLNLNG